MPRRPLSRKSSDSSADILRDVETGDAELLIKVCLRQTRPLRFAQKQVNIGPPADDRNGPVLAGESQAGVRGGFPGQRSPALDGRPGHLQPARRLAIGQPATIASRSNATAAAGRPKSPTLGPSDPGPRRRPEDRCRIIENFDPKSDSGPREPLVECSDGVIRNAATSLPSVRRPTWRVVLARPQRGGSAFGLEPVPDVSLGSTAGKRCTQWHGSETHLSFRRHPGPS